MSLKSAELLKKAALQNRGKVGNMTPRQCSVMRTFEMPSLGDFTDGLYCPFAGFI